ncbi:MAG: hypothetical protein ACTSO7_06750 [Candidatus Heimdallarchaeota archaeon]
MDSQDVELTLEQKELLYLLFKLTDSENCPNNWIKETPLQALIFQGIRKGLFNGYDYAPISTSFLGKGRKFVNISKEGEDDLGDLREFGLLETIRLSSTKHNFITGFRPTTESSKHLNNFTNEEKSRVDNLFICSSCKTESLELFIDSDTPEFLMQCNTCEQEEVIPLIIPEDVSYSTRPYYLESLTPNKKLKEIK